MGQQGTTWEVISPRANGGVGGTGWVDRMENAGEALEAGGAVGVPGFQLSVG